MYKDGLNRYQHIRKKINSEIRGQGHWNIWQKILFLAFLLTLLVINAAGLFQCLSLIVNIYYQLIPSTFKDINMIMTLGGIVFFISGAVASARILSRALPYWAFGVHDQIEQK